MFLVSSSQDWQQAAASVDAQAKQGAVAPPEAGEVAVSSEKTLSLEHQSATKVDYHCPAFETKGGGAVYSEPLVGGSHDSQGNVKIQEEAATEPGEGTLDGSHAPEDAELEELEGVSTDFLTEVPEAALDETPDEPFPPDGEVEYIDDDGKKHCVTFADGEPNGPFQIFDAEGNLELEGEMAHGKICNEYKSYEKGVLRTQVAMEDGVPHGVMKQFDDEGNLSAEITFEKGNKQGEMKTFHPSGEVASEITYKNDQKNGPMKTFSENGELMIQASYKDDKLDGTLENFYTGPNGNGCLRSADYKKDQLDGKETIYQVSGQIISETEYKDGQPVSEA